MTAMMFKESALVQMPMVHHAEGIGWIPVPPEEARTRRGGTAGLIFREELEAALRRFNPWLTPEVARSVIDRLEALPATIEGNREVLAWLRGERSAYDEVEGRQRPVILIHFDNPEANVLHVTWEWTLKPPARKGNRADVMFLVNGIPVAIVESKNPKDADAIERGLGQLLRYEKETPELLGMVQLFNVTHMLDYWYGVTWNLSRRFMARWKERPEDSYRFAVQSFFEPTDFLRTLGDWILFYVEDGETRKTVLRQHQRRAVDRIVERCSDPEKQRGLIWHTQGSGKTFTLLTAARVILERKDDFHNPTVIVVVDRTELEGQLKGWVERLLGEMQQQDIPIWQANSRAELRELLETDKRGLIVSMIHKFDGIEKDANTQDNVYVFIDEAHRSVARDLGTYLMAALPNSTIIGFTGTPIARTDHGEGTFKIFSAEDEAGYLDKYSIVESIEDETTLPIRHTMAPSEMTVPEDQLDEEFFALAEMEGVTDVDELNSALDRAVGLRTFLTSDDRIEKVAAFVAEHFRENVMPLGYKAFLVAVNREACAKYKRALDKLLPPEWSTAVYSENERDFTERPLVAELQLSAQQETDTRANFKKTDEEPKILIVTDKLLTGYDAPLLYCMYLDKPMRDHVLLQAIARVNRPYVDPDGNRKRVGLVVDFVGVLRELRKALRFDSSDVSGAIEGMDILMSDFQSKIAQAEADYLGDLGTNPNDESLEKVVFGRFLAPEARQMFFDRFKEIEVLWEILSPSPELRDYMDTYRSLAQLYSTVRGCFSTSGVSGDVAGLANKTLRLVQENSTQVGLGNLTKSVTFDVSTLEALQNEKGDDEPKVFNLVRGLQIEVEDHPEKEPVLRPLQERAQLILKDLEQRTITGLAAMDLLAAVANDKESAEIAEKDSGLSPQGFAIYWSLKDDSAIQTGGISAMNLAQEAEDLRGRYPNAATNIEEERRLRGAMYGPVLSLPQETRARTVEHILAILLDKGNDVD